jgi:metallo-beta-lactamase family protein
MELRFFGATGDTTGSCHMVRLGRHAVLLDCGFYQGRREESYRRNSRFAFSPSSIDAVVQSHAHIDHSGKLPMLVRHGFGGRIHATPATIDLCEVLLRDSAHIMLSDAEFMNRQRMRRKLETSRRTQRASRRWQNEPGQPSANARPESLRRDGSARFAPHSHGSGGRFELPRPVLANDRAVPIEPAELPKNEVMPLYLDEDVVRTLRLFQPHAYHEWFEAAPNMRFRFRDAGHIIGSAWVEAEIGSGADMQRLVFTGDYGRWHQPILRDPEPLSDADVYISESTYGNRSHPPIEHLDDDLAAVVRRLAERGRGRVLIPAFAVGRTQHILYSLSRLFAEKRCPPVQVVVDSPLARAATRIVMAHPECFDDDALALYERYQTDPAFRGFLRFTESVAESRALNEEPRPLVIISASGMMESGRILHHLAWNIQSPETEILIVGFQAPHTLGRRLVEGAERVSIMGGSYAVRARVTPILGFSAHADREGLIQVLEPHADRAKAIFLVHGEDEQRGPLATALGSHGFRRVEQPSAPDTYRV